MKILVKYPTRSRPQRFLETLRGWINLASKPEVIFFLCNYDNDDATMTGEVVASTQGLGAPVIVFHGQNRTKIEAFNAHMGVVVRPWDVLLAVSDDQFCRRQGWDEVIRQSMSNFFPDLDGFLWFHDGSKQRSICTQSCMGRKYYNRDGYIYHPSYSSFFCDNEATEVARSRGKLTFIDEVLATHEHPAWQGGMKPDALYQRNNKYWSRDQANFNKRKSLGFPA